jgi:hypothetical protein
MASLKILKTPHADTSIPKISANVYATNEIDNSQTLEIVTPSMVSFVAASESGKTYYMMYMLRELMQKKAFDFVFVISSTSFTGEWSNIVSSDNVTDTFDKKFVYSLLDAQEKLKKAGKINRGLLIIDDMMGCMSVNEPVLIRLAASARHYGLSVWFSVQHWNKLNTAVREGSKYMMILNTVSAKAADKICDEFAISHLFPKPVNFVNHCELVMRDRGVLVLAKKNAHTHVYRARADSIAIPYEINMKKIRKRKTKQKT